VRSLKALLYSFDLGLCLEIEPDVHTYTQEDSTLEDKDIGDYVEHAAEAPPPIIGEVVLMKRQSQPVDHCPFHYLKCDNAVNAAVGTMDEGGDGIEIALVHG
jgi:hypothetical protein